MSSTIQGSRRSSIRPFDLWVLSTTKSTSDSGFQTLGPLGYNDKVKFPVIRVLGPSRFQSQVQTSVLFSLQSQTSDSPFFLKENQFTSSRENKISSELD